MSDDDEIVGRKSFPPDPGLVKSLGANHKLPTALADLVDNSIDAGASRVLIRFLRTGYTLQEIHVLDDGWGMDSSGIEKAMTLGAGRDYEDRSLGHFGVGLKAAALSTGDTLTLWSQRYGSTPVGMRMDKKTFQKDYSCAEMSVGSAQAAEAARVSLVGGGSGTTVRLSDLRSRYSGQSEAEADLWLHLRMHEARTHLGMVFHRLLANGRVRVELEEGLVDGDRGAPANVPAIDPFGYKNSGRAGFPRRLSTSVDGRSVTIDCHIWPPRQTDLPFRLGTRDGRAMQGFYVYRADRLLSAGGWLDVTHETAERALGRVAIEYEDVADHVAMNPEKSSIGFDAVLNGAVHKATDGEKTFADYLADVEEVVKAAKRRQRVRKPSVGLDKGFAPGLRRVIADELDVDETYDPVSIKWKRLPQGELIDVDFAGSTVWLNNYYRELLAGAGKRGMNDAPVIKALVYLLTRDKFMGQYLGSKDKDDIALWQEVLGGAVQAEVERRDNDE